MKGQTLNNLLLQIKELLLNVKSVNYSLIKSLAYGYSFIL